MTARNDVNALEYRGRLMLLDNILKCESVWFFREIDHFGFVLAWYIKERFKPKTVYKIR